VKSIAINFPAVKIKIPGEGMDFEKLEEIVFEVTRHIGREALVRTMENLDEELMKERPRGELSNEGKKEKYFGTRLGDIRYERRAYKEKGKKGYRYLLEEELGIKKNQRVSKSVEEIESLLAFVGGGYRKAEGLIEKLVGCSRSFESIRRGAIREGEEIKRHEEGEIWKIRNLKEEYKGEESEVVYIEADGTGLKLQRRKKKRGKKRGTEIKLGIGYRGWEDRYKRGEKKAKKLKGKFIYGGIESGEEFMEKLSLIGEKELGISKAKEVVVGGDGAGWIKNNIRGYFGLGAIYQLCRYHLNREIKWGLGYDREVEKEVRRLVVREEIDRAIELIEKEVKKGRGEREKLRGLQFYIADNREGINGIKELKNRKVKGEIRKTGAIEGNIDKVISNRFKKRGMSWSVRGAEGLLKVGTKILNGKWEEWWEKERGEKIEIKREKIKGLIPANLWEEDRDRKITEIRIPCLHGPHQDRPWVEVIRKLIEIDGGKELEPRNERARGLS